MPVGFTWEIFFDAKNDRPISDDHLNSNHKNTVMKTNAINASNGMVIKPNQLMYSPLQGTPL